MRPLAAGIMLLLASAPAGAAATGVQGDMVRVVLKFVKRTPSAQLRFDPVSCPSCTAVTDANWNADNALETVIALAVPKRRTLELAFKGSSSDIRRVLLEGGDIPFRREGSGIVVSLPPVGNDAITTAEVATHIVEPGMVLRFEHADPARRAGPYAQGAFPVVQRAAADVLEFAQREVVRELGLGEQVERERLGRIQIMGFDTNAPHDLRDDPPPRVAAAVRTVAHLHVHLGREHDVVAPSLEGLADDLLGLALRIDVSGVDEVDPGIERRVDDPDRLGVVGVPPRAEHHRPEAERRHHETAVAESEVVHAGIIIAPLEGPAPGPHPSKSP